MSEWNNYKLGELCSKITSGGTPNTQSSEYYGGNIPWLRTQEIKFNRIYHTEIHITEQGLLNSSARWIPANSVIIAMYGATAGRVAINKIPLATNQACCNLIINPDKADYRFIYYIVLSRFSEIAKMAVGGAQQNLNAAMIKDLSVRCPSLLIQSSISEILTSLDDKIDLNNKINKNLEDLAQALYKQWFVDFEFPNENEGPYKSAGGEMVESEMGEIPVGWKIELYGNIVKTTSGGTPSRNKSEYYQNGKILWVKSKELNNTIIFETEEKINDLAIKNSSAKLIPAYSVLIAMYGATVGQIGLLTMEASCNQAICVVQPNDFIPYTFNYLFFQNYRKLFSNLAVGSAQQNISQDLIKKTKVVVPSYDIMQKFHQLVDYQIKLIENNCRENHQLSILRDTLLPKLISGELQEYDDEYQTEMVLK